MFAYKLIKLFFFQWLKIQKQVMKHSFIKSFYICCTDHTSDLPEYKWNPWVTGQSRIKLQLTKQVPRSEARMSSSSAGGAFLEKDRRGQLRKRRGNCSIFKHLFSCLFCYRVIPSSLRWWYLIFLPRIITLVIEQYLWSFILTYNNEFF